MVRMVAEFRIALNAAPLPEPWERLVKVQELNVTNAAPETKMTEWVTGTGEVVMEGETVTEREVDIMISVYAPTEIVEVSFVWVPGNK